MSRNLNFTRLIQLVKRQWQENSRLYMYSVLALVFMEALIFWLWIANGGPEYHGEVPYLIFIAGIYICGFIFASFSFNQLSDKTKATYWLSVPASHLEKLICVIFYSTIVFAIVFCTTFFLVQSVAVAYVKDMVAADPTIHFTEVDLGKGGFGEVFWAFMYGFVAIQAFYLLGSVYFSRYAFILTTVVGAAIIIIFIYYTSKMMLAFFGDNYVFNLTSVKSFDTDDHYYRSYELSNFGVTVLEIIFKYSWAPVFWVATWYRLKEKQV